MYNNMERNSRLIGKDVNCQSMKYIKKPVSIRTINRICRMEIIFDRLQLAVKRGENVSKIKKYKYMEKVLTRYYECGQWLKDYKLEENGLLPSDLNRGVLSEDGVWNLLCDIKNQNLNEE